MRRDVLAWGAAVFSICSMTACGGGNGAQSSALAPIPAGNRISVSGAAEQLGAGASPSVKLYLSELSGTVLGYKAGVPKHGAPVCSITKGINFPTGLTTDSTGNLYVGTSTVSGTNEGPPYYIYVFAPNCGKQIAKITDPYLGFGNPRHMVVSGSTIYVGNQFGLKFPTAKSKSNGSNIAVCSLAGCTRSLKGSSEVLLDQIMGVAVDSAGNVYADTFTGNRNGVLATQIVEWAKGKGRPKVVATVTQAQSVGAEPSPGAIHFDSQGNLLVSDGAGDLYIFTGCPTKCVEGSVFPFKNPDTIDFVIAGKGDTNIYASNEVGTLDVYSYKGTSGITYEYSVSSGLSSTDTPYALALVPRVTK